MLLTMTITSDKHRIPEFGLTMLDVSSFDLKDVAKIATVGVPVLGGVWGFFRVLNKLD
jgi:hypothetical protein